MKKVKVRTFSGVVCEQEIYIVPEGTAKHNAEKRLRFKTDEERELHRDNISRKRHARAFNANFSPRSLYSTLTFDDEHEVHTFAEARRVRDTYYNKLKYAFPDAVIFLYMGRGKTTNRIHFHMVSNGIPAEVISGKWGCGDVVRINNLREHCYYDGVDHGQDYSGLADYLFNHWTPEQGGHRWKQSKNAKKPEREEPTECKRDYSEDKPPRAPMGYKLVETKITQYGYMYFKYILEPPPKKRKRREMNT